MSQCMFFSVHRTNIYLSQAEQVALDARAVAEGRSRSEVVRAIIDRELNLHEHPDLDAILYELAEELAEQARALSADDPDLRVE